MAYTYKILGQLNPEENLSGNLYQVPAANSAVISTLVACNQGASAGTYRVAIRPAAEPTASKHYIVYDTSVPANDTVTLTIGMSLAATDLISVQANSNNFSFSLFGTEIA